VANPWIVPVGLYVANGFSSWSSYVTFSFVNTAGFDAYINCKIITPTNVSASPQIFVFQSTDGGNTYSNVLNSIGAVFAATPSVTQVVTLKLRDPGIYLIAFLGGGGNSAATFSYAFETAQLISAYA
jgi:hypothetical protein